MNLRLLRKKLFEVTGNTKELDYVYQLPDKLDRINLWNKDLSNSFERYFLLYSGPIIEFSHTTALCSKELTDLQFSSLLESHSILSLHLRILDNVVDGDVEGEMLKESVRISNGLLAEAISRIYTGGCFWNSDSQRLCDKWISYESSLLEGRLLITNELWERASPLLVIPKLYFSLNNEAISVFQSYLSTLMLVHDIQDVFDDFRAGRRTIPVELLKSTQNKIKFTKNTHKILFDNLVPQLFEELRVLRLWGETNKLIYWSTLLNDVEEEITSGI